MDSSARQVTRVINIINALLMPSCLSSRLYKRPLRVDVLWSDVCNMFSVVNLARGRVGSPRSLTQRKEVVQAALGRAIKLLAFGSAAGLLLGILASRGANRGPYIVRY